MITTNWTGYYSLDLSGWVVSFEVKNSTRWTIKDFTVLSIYLANSGTVVDTNLHKLYDFVPPGKSKFFSFVVHDIHGQATDTEGMVVDLDLEGYIPVAALTPPSAAELRAAQEATARKKQELTAKAVKANEEGAARGDAYDQYRLGQRYRDGDGVPKDLSKARALFEKAAAQGDSNAKRELAGLP